MAQEIVEEEEEEEAKLGFQPQAINPNVELNEDSVINEVNDGLQSLY